MLSFFQTRKSAYFNIALLFLVALVWCISSTHNVVRSFFKEEHLFYGTVSQASIPSLFGGTDIPFLDRTFFQINGDKDATFILYTSKEINDEMAEWFSFAEEGASEIPLEISAVRVKDNTFVVKYIGNSDGELDWETLVEYQISNLMVFGGIALICFVAMVVFAVLGIRTKRRPLRRT
ncbi:MULTISPECIES: hypothetical protein [unclassified Fibrobacter]|jgi:hypothetical protein|uniref:hypothetical protein n=1 Tax=unclassified Fibrobacter TaxID=2634177 RepID=UPI0015633501|nr:MULTISPECIES: hypothetical protein [unclassified Fibrobacter]